MFGTRGEIRELVERVGVLEAALRDAIDVIESELGWWAGADEKLEELRDVLEAE